MIKVNNKINDVQENFYMYYVNSALLFTRIYGTYRVGSEVISYSSATMVLGQTYTLNFPPGAYALQINIDTSAYFSWTNCYSQYVDVIQPSLCLYTIGLVFHVACFDAACNNRKIESLISKYLLENPIDYKNINTNRSVYKDCCNKKNNSSCKNKCNLCISEVTKKYMNQVRNYAKTMKDYLPDDVLFYLNIER